MTVKKKTVVVKTEKPVMLDVPIEIRLPLHPTNNHLYKNTFGGRRAMSTEGVRWKADAKRQIMAAYPGLVPTNQPALVRVTMNLKHDRDIDSVKALLDAMTGMVYTDDSLITRLVVRKIKTKEVPSVDVMVESMEPPIFSNG